MQSEITQSEPVRCRSHAARSMAKIRPAHCRCGLSAGKKRRIQAGKQRLKWPMLLVNGEEHRQKHGRWLIPEADTSEKYRASPAAERLPESAPAPRPDYYQTIRCGGASFPFLHTYQDRWRILGDVCTDS